MLPKLPAAFLLCYDEKDLYSNKLKGSQQMTRCGAGGGGFHRKPQAGVVPAFIQAGGEGFPFYKDFQRRGVAENPDLLHRAAGAAAAGPSKAAGAQR